MPAGLVRPAPHTHLRATGVPPVSSVVQIQEGRQSGLGMRPPHQPGCVDWELHASQQPCAATGDSHLAYEEAHPQYWYQA